MKTLFHIFRIILSVVFIISGLSKIISPQTFAEAINSLFNFPELISKIIQILIPIIEIILGIKLLLSNNSHYVYKMLITLTTVFFTISIYGYQKEVIISCGCFGDILNSRFSIEMIVRNLILLIMSGFLLFGFNKINSNTLNKNN